MGTEGIRATVSGSFRKHMAAVQDAVYELTDAGVEVLSPSDPRVVDAFGDFLFVASDRLRAVRSVQSRHLVAISRSQFLWLVAPAGYVGPSAAMELGFAFSRGIPIFTLTPPTDLTMRQFVTVVPSVAAAVDMVASPSHRAGTVASSALLLDPGAAVEQGHGDLDTLAQLLLRPPRETQELEIALAEKSRRLRSLVHGI